MTYMNDPSKIDRFVEGIKTRRPPTDGVKGNKAYKGLMNSATPKPVKTPKVPNSNWPKIVSTDNNPISKSMEKLYRKPVDFNLRENKS